MKLLQALKRYGGARAVNGGGHPPGSENLDDGVGVVSTPTFTKCNLDEMDAIHVYDGKITGTRPLIRTRLPVVAKLDNETASTERMGMKRVGAFVPTLKNSQLLEMAVTESLRNKTYIYTM